MLTKTVYTGAVAALFCASASVAGQLNVKNAGTFVTSVPSSTSAAPSSGAGGGGLTGGFVPAPVPVTNNFQAFSPPQLQQTVTLLTTLIANPPAGVTPAQLQILQAQLAQAQAVLAQQ